jgi:hypothetical protein
MKNLRLFSRLCGREAMPNIVIVTTMWDIVPAKLGTGREDELKRDVWDDMLRSGSGFKRFGGNYESAWDIVGHPLKKDSGAPYLTQEEMDDIIKSTEDKGNDEVRKRLKQIRRGLSRWVIHHYLASKRI